ncbi:glycosyltransferase family 1 protein [Coleophoma crateriformis]|uniref:Glycosyltransferase family 1 protein n=1 Tax=Coleophoma crateriformis TaxID=565419 RepID=A0A3D8Q3M3_9HELO|nr:glycosyltransferase family 1 protein [Coleophoma crateriformis]
MSNRKSVLFFTNEEFGQTNVILAVAYELLRQNEINVHIASWPAFQPRVAALSEKVQKEKPEIEIRPIQFHVLPLSPMFDLWVQNGGSRSIIPHPPGKKGITRLKKLVTELFGVWNPTEYIMLFETCRTLVDEVNPGLIVLDPVFPPAHDLCRTLGLNYAVLSPCTLVPGLNPEQPWLAGFWKYPALSTGFPYPVPWNLIPENLYCTWVIISCLWDPRIKALDAARHAHGIRGILPSFTPWVKDVPHICPSLPEIDLPVVIPPNVHNTGPILVATPPIAESDPELLSWLEQRPTILVSLGTLFEAVPETVKELCLGFRILLETRPDIQILWKLKPKSSFKKEINDIVQKLLFKELNEGRVRIESWLQAEPLAILESGHIICSVHHGGANSYFETTWAGVPQVVLPHWYDTYDYATRAEYLGIGVYGNYNAGHIRDVKMENYVSPTMVDHKEFGKALLKVVGKEAGDSGDMRERARELGNICHNSGGRIMAAEIITELTFKK